MPYHAKNLTDVLRRRWAKFCPFLTALLLVLIFNGPAPARGSDFTIYEGFKTLAHVFYEINARFVEEPDSSEMVQGAVRGMLNTLDPHSSYMTADEMAEFQQEATGSFTGVGMELSTRDSVLTVVAPIDDTPASRAGIMSGDQIVSIDDKSTKDMSITEAVKLIRGPKGTKVTISVARKGATKPLTFTLVRDFIPLRSVRSEELSPGIGYVHITNFQGDTAQEVEKALAKLAAAKPLEGLVLDLRNDPGGLLDQSVKVSGLFVGPVLVVETRGRLDDQNMGYNSDREAILPYQCPIVVLVNEGSASASEIVAGALQDYRRALILGARTFGKGSVQSVVRLPDGSGLRLTTARFYTPSGRAIQSDGIIPDVEVPSLLPPKYKVTRESDLEGHLLGDNEKPQGKNAADEAAQEQDPQDEEEAAEDPLLEKPLYEMTLTERLQVDKQLAQALEMLKNGQVRSEYTGVAPVESEKAVG
ncbi:MAG: S41 family peptidase [Deltaproteobacteria bacterium]|jgi:carboxyl-terminal processing protease|nr:S41 family peptidase [Deltaproteobacteria bacterium]